MSRRPGAAKSDAGKLVEKQMRNWELSKAQRPQPKAAEPARVVEDFVAISRMVGAGGHDIATELGKRLQWPVFDREILQAMAGDDQIRSRLYESLDERDLGWIEDTLRWLVAGDFRKEDYFHRLSETVLALARQSRVVFLGRGVDLMLPRDRGLRVGLVASRDYRARRFAQRNKISEALARAEVERIQQERTDFLRRHFGRVADDPIRHDLLLNTEHFTAAEAVELICHALRIRGMLK